MLGLVYDPKVESFLRELDLSEAALSLPLKKVNHRWAGAFVETASSGGRQEGLVRQIGQRVEEMAVRVLERVTAAWRNN